MTFPRATGTRTTVRLHNPARFRTTAGTRTAAVLAAAALVGVAAGCAGTGSEPPADGRKVVLASFYPLQYVAQQVGGNLVEVRNLTPPAAEPHDLELSPAQVRAVGQADLVVYLSGFQPAVDEAIDRRKPAHVVDAADDAELEARPNGAAATAVPDADADSAEAAGPEPDHGTDTDADHGHDHALDPHFWLDPTRLARIAEPVAMALVAVDPENAAAYQANAARLTADLTDLDTRFTTGLAPCPGAVLVTSHAAFGYLAQRYDLIEVGITGSDPEAEPAPARLREVSGIIRDKNVRTLFAEPGAGTAVTRALAADLGLDAADLDPLESQLDPDADYVQVMAANLNALTKGLTCR